MKFIEPIEPDEDIVTLDVRDPAYSPQVRLDPKACIVIGSSVAEVDARVERCYFDFPKAAAEFHHRAIVAERGFGLPPNLRDRHG